ncbi:MAG: hypothetical protein ACTSP6_03045 [Promethearchaeota archaeon]
MSNKKELDDEDLELLKDLFRKSEEQKDSIEDIKEFTTPKRRAITNTKITKIQLQIDEANENIPQTETVDKKEPIHIDRIKKKVKKKEILSQIYETIPVIRENNILLKEIAQNLQTIDFKFKSLMQGPIKIKVVK